MTGSGDLSDRLDPQAALAVGGAGIGALALPVVLSEFYLILVTEIVIFAIFAVAFNLAFGFAEIASFGHAAFFGLGAYGFAIGLQITPGSIVLPLVLAVSSAIVYGVVVGLVSTQGSGIYFALLTFAFAQGLYEIALRFPNLSGGSGGLFVSIPDLPFGISLSGRLTVYYVSLFLLVSLLLFGYHLIASPFGRVMQAIKHNPNRAEAIGIPVRRVRIVVFTLSGALTSVAGVLLILNTRFVSPDVFFFQTSIDVLVMAILGGTGSLWGPIAGAAFLVTVEEVVSGLANVGTLITGSIFIIVIFFFPKGISGLFE